jgi:transmembrane sensor
MNAKNKKFLTEKFHAYQEERLSEPEKKVIDEWFDSKMEKIKEETFVSDSTTAKIHNDLFVNISQAIRLNPARKSWYNSGWLKVACTLLVLSGLYFLTLPPKQTNKAVPAAAWTIYSTPKGKVKKITLSDGTHVWLNAETKIRISADFGTLGIRKLQLDYGEAFFKVKHDNSRPFSISTGAFVTTVLGTSFNIRSYPELDSYKVAVATGKVKVDYHEGSKSIALSTGLVKGQVLTYNLRTQKPSIVSGNVNDLSDWKSNRSLYFDNLTLAQIGAELSRQYDMEVKITGKTKTDQTYTMELAHKDLQVVLRQIVLKTGISYQLNSKVLTLNPPL